MSSPFTTRATLCALLLSTTILAACDSAEKRAEEHYQSALELLEEGDVSRAALEFRNVFNLDGQHREARMAYATMMRDSNDLQEAFSQFLLVSEQYPDDPVPRLELAEIAILVGEWDQAKRHSEKVTELAPDDARGRAISAIINYQEAIEAEDDPARRAAAVQVAQVGGDLADERLAAQIEIDNLLRDQKFGETLEALDRALEVDPENEQNQQLKLQILGQLADQDGIQEQLETMVRLFPENEGYSGTLIQWYVAKGNTDAAEAFIRERIASSEGEEADTQRVLLLRFMQELHGMDAALEQAEAFIAEDVNTPLYRSLKSGLLFDSGNRNAGIAEMESVVATYPENEKLTDYKVALAQMQTNVGNDVAARQLVEEVLADDAGHVAANKLRAGWLIEDDMPDEAIVALRQALDQAPNDPQIMSLMAQAHLRNGSRGLAGEMLSLAVEASGSAPEESVTYARFLAADNNLTSAESILVDSLRVSPNNQPVLELLGQIYVAQEDWPRVEQVEGTLRRLAEDAGVGAADALQVARLRGQGRADEAVNFLEELAAASGAGSPADVSIVRQRIAAGEIEAAKAYVAEKLAAAPDNIVLRSLEAAIAQVEGRTEDAEAGYRALLAENPEIETLWRTLYTMKLRQGDPEAASVVLEEALEVVPDAANLQWALAGELERAGDIDGAINIYEGLYERLPNSPILANNLASLMATYRVDDESLERAYTIARRLRGLEVPAFQDTYGWIAQRRGDTDEALAHLEPAAAGLPADPLVQYHYAVALASAGRTEEAIAQFRVALDVAGPADTREQFETAKAEIARLEAELEAASEGSATETEAAQ
ncbi:MAG: tetratricopeptide repeat protein [Pseudomonadota bacterium]